MAILKHGTSKNSNYNDVFSYLLYEHDEYTMKPILDKNGDMVRRRGYILDGINCNPFTYAEECRELNRQYRKNQKASETKAHHYIISFDPLDQSECGLTGEKAQELGIEFAKKNFPGHQTLVCTHMDGHNGSGNIHVHIVFNSLRKYDIEQPDYSERSCDSRAGYKHHPTLEYLDSMRASLMEICNREGLHQVELLTPSENKISEREYWVKKRGQAELDKTNKEVIEFGLTPAKTVFQTQKQFLRDAISVVSNSATSFEEFQKILFEKYSIQVTDKKYRYTYLHPERSKNITERALGTNYGKEYLMKLLEENSLKYKVEESLLEENTLDSSEDENDIQDIQIDYSFSPTIFGDSPPDYVEVFFLKSDLRLVVDLQSNVKAQQSRAYAQKVKLTNLKQMAQTIIYVQQNGYDTREALQSSYDEILAKRIEARQELREAEDKLKEVNEVIHYMGQYLSNKKVFGEMLSAKNKKKFREAHSPEIEVYETAVKFLKGRYTDGKIPSMKTLQQEKQSLTIRRDAKQNTYNYLRDYANELKTVCSNVDAILNPQQEKEVKKAKQQEIS
ncbi:MAG: relaxase/mobilization nuclease domain-containing protein [Oscillospiraceae bacterium]|nr:relaxase/mobilization nuclease domain-containing protein [Oscillospiraceae bacterium]